MTLSAAALAAINAQQTGELPIVLLTIDHDDLPAPIRISKDPTTRLTLTPLVYGAVSRGDEYLYVPFNIQLPDEKEDTAPSARLVLSNVDRGMIPLLRSTTTAAKVTIEVVLASDPDTVEIEFPAIDLQVANYNADSITFTLGFNSLDSEAFPAGTFTPNAFPALF